MHKIAIILLILFIPVMLAAQEDSDPSRETDWDDYVTDLYTRGDQTFIISLGTVFPAVFINNGEVIHHNIKPPVGGSGSLIYNYYLNSDFFIGGEVIGMFLPTLGKNTLYIIPLGFRGGYQLNVWKLEIPLSVSLGMSWHRLLNSGYYGLYARAGGAVYYRAINNWSFGLSTNWYWLPEWTSDKSKNVHGNIIDLMLTARYHF